MARRTSAMEDANYLSLYRAKEAVEKLTGESVTAKH